MAETKYGKYIISDLQHPKEEAPWNPPVTDARTGNGGRTLYLDNDVIPGAFYMETVWVMPRPRLSPERYEEVKKRSPGPHAHDYDEIIAFFGSDPKNPYDLGAEVELWLGDEKHIINKTSMVFIPAGLMHAPLVFLQVDRPVFHFTTGPGKQYF
ncbi:MAG: hypothetical protein PHG35_06845 [Dehalococcoidales bacterium]|nr:hypothetical protein [Dehalococcoidales bacterium]